nr:MAG TPA: hypothetical protein [Caudoviricetes sp.]
MSAGSPCWRPPNRYKNSPCCSILPDGQHEENGKYPQGLAKFIMARSL